MDVADEEFHFMMGISLFMLMLVLQLDEKLCYLFGLYRIQDSFLLVSLTRLTKTGQASSQSGKQRHKIESRPVTISRCEMDNVLFCS
jgi:hypothetical protein